MRDVPTKKSRVVVETLEGRWLMTSDGAWLGINSGNIDQGTLISDLNTTGVKVVRDGDNAATTSSDNAAFAARVQNYVNAGIDAHISINYRGNGIDVSDYNTWLANYKARCVDIMTYYKGKLDYYIVGNEPDKADPFTGNLTPQQAVDFTRMAYEAARQVDPTGGIKVESAPVSSNSPANNYFQDMFADGLTNDCDYVGMHIYSSQINDGRLNLPWTYMAAAGGTQKPFAVSEMGVSSDWAPAGDTAAQKQQWMADFLDQAYVQLKRYGIGNVIMFESSSSSSGPAKFNLLRDGTASRTILTATYSEIQNHLSSGALQDAGFESTNDYKRQWVVYDDPSDGTWDTSAYNFQAAGGHSGSYALQMDTSGSGNRIVRQVIGGLTVGQSVTLTAWVYSTNPNGATLKAEGYNATNGDAETAATTNAIGAWKQLTVTVTPTNPWVVMELSTVANGIAGSYVKFDDASLKAGGLPANFADSQIGAPAIQGTSSFDGSTVTVAGAGTDFWGTSDQGNFVDEHWTKDGTIIAHVASQQNTNGFAKAGIMFRADPNANSANVALLETPSAGLVLQVRATDGASTIQEAAVTGLFAPEWVKLVRSGNTFTAYYGSDGVHWMQLGTSYTATMSSIALAGLAVTSHNAAALSTATFDHLNLLSNPIPQTYADGDIGSPGLAGSASYDGATYTVSGGGADLYGASDQGNFMSQAWSGNGTLIAQIGGLTNTNSSAKAGIMFRNGTGATAAFIDLVLTPGGGLYLQGRSADGGSGITMASVTGLVGPLWVKLVRSGNAFTAFYSSNGSTWTQLGVSQTITMNTNVLAGLAVTAHNNSALCTATFNSLSLG